MAASDIPPTMKAVQVLKFGPLSQENISVMEVPVPDIKPDQVLIQVYAAGCNGIDFKMAKGAHMSRALPDFLNLVCDSFVLTSISL